MIILTQNKKQITDNLNIKIIPEIAEGETSGVSCYTLMNEKYVELGWYGTEERAKEVLNEIIDAYIDCNEEPYFENYGYVKNKVYQMPEK